MQLFSSNRRKQQDGDDYRSFSSCSQSSGSKLREPPKTPPHQQLFAVEPSAPRKRKAPHHPDLTLIERPSKKRAELAESLAQPYTTSSPRRMLPAMPRTPPPMPYTMMDVHQKPSGDVVAISPTGTICRCHLTPGAICRHQIYEPRVSDAVARAEYEQASPIQQVMQRRAANQQRERANEVRQLHADAKVVREEGEQWLEREKRRKERGVERWVRANDGKWVVVPDGHDDGFVEDDDDSGPDGDDDDGGDAFDDEDEGGVQIKIEPGEETASEDDSDISEWDADEDSEEEDDDDEDGLV